MDVSPVSLAIIGLFSGIGTAAGNWFFDKYLKPHSERIIENSKVIFRKDGEP